MATTATNKQPLLVDRVFHNVINSNSLTSGSDTSLDILGTNESTILLDCSTNDGGTIEDLYVISRTPDSTAYTAVFYFSSASDYLRPTEAVYVGKIESSTTLGEVTSSAELPKVMVPLPNTGSDAQIRGLYVPKGKVLWVSLKLAGPVNSSDTPVIGAQGGYY
jgi:hypothetical protein